MLFSIKKLGRQHFILLGAVWVCLQIFLLFQYGIVTTLEATKYVAQADHLIQHGHYETGNFLFYSTEILLIAACKKISIGYWPVVAVQFFFNALSIVCFYRLVQRFTQRIAVSFWATLAFIGLYYYQLYNVYLFTESLYFSFSILFFYRLITIKRLSFFSFAGLMACMSVLYFTRPVGLFFIPATFLYLVLKFYPRRAFLIFTTAGAGLLVLFYLLLNASLNSGGELDFVLPYLDERIICGVPTVAVPHQINVPGQQNSVQGLFYIITHHWNLFSSLAIRRLLAFFGVLRSWYSLPHNIFIGFYFYTAYLLILAGIKKWKKAIKPELSFILCLTFLTAVTAALSCDEWHNRFIFTILPFLLLLATLPFAVFPSKTSAHD